MPPLKITTPYGPGTVIETSHYGVKVQLPRSTAWFVWWEISASYVSHTNK